MSEVNKKSWYLHFRIKASNEINETCDAVTLYFLENKSAGGHRGAPKTSHATGYTKGHGPQEYTHREMLQVKDFCILVLMLSTATADAEWC